MRSEESGSELRINPLFVHTSGGRETEDSVGKERFKSHFYFVCVDYLDPLISYENAIFKTFIGRFGYIDVRGLN